MKLLDDLESTIRVLDDDFEQFTEYLSPLEYQRVHQFFNAYQEARVTLEYIAKLYLTARAVDALDDENGTVTVPAGMNAIFKAMALDKYRGTRQ